MSLLSRLFFSSDSKPTKKAKNGNAQHDAGAGPALAAHSKDAKSSGATGQNPAVLAPGVQRYLWYTVHNPLSVPITVNHLSVPSVTPPAGCPTSNLDVTHTSFGGSLVVPAAVSSVPGTNSVAVPISLINASADQVGCRNATFSFTFAGSATYTEVYATSAAISSSINPSSIGQGVTYTATITGVVGTDGDTYIARPSSSIASRKPRNSP